MSVKSKHRIEFGLLVTVLATVLLVWHGTRAVGPEASPMLVVVGGTLPSEATDALQVLNRELEGARCVLSLGSSELLFSDRNGQPREFRFVAGTLWNNRLPVVSGVSAFHFEYRDTWGNLLTCREQNRESIRTIGYTLRLRHRNQDVLANSQVVLSKGQDPSLSYAFLEALSR
jgi:hypothetical protein